MTAADAAIVSELSKPIWGTEVCQVRINVQHGFQNSYRLETLDGLWLDFREFRPNRERGKPIPRVASLYVNLSSCGARLEQHGVPLVVSGDPPVTFLNEIQRLVCDRLIDVTAQFPGGDMSFRFESGLALNCFPASSREGDAWVIETELEDKLKLGPGSRVTYISGIR